MSNLKLTQLLFWVLPISAFAATQHDNIICVKNGSIQLIYQTHQITKNQPWGGVVNSNGCVTVKAGRNKTSQVVTSLKQQLQQIGPIGTDGSPTGVPLNKYTAITGYYGDDTPGSLNWWVMGTLLYTLNNITYQCQNFIMAQGSLLKGQHYNNWWAFANYYSSPYNSHTIECLNTFDNNTVYFKMRFDGSSTLILNQVAAVSK
jgi:hypothetical protein